MSLISEEKREYWEERSKEDLDSIIERIKKRKPKANKNYVKTLAYHAKVGLEEEIFPIITSKKSIDEMVKELERAGKSYAYGSITCIRSSLIAAGFVKKKRSYKPSDLRDYFNTINEIAPCTTSELAEKAGMSSSRSKECKLSLQKKGKIVTLKNPYDSEEEGNLHNFFGEIFPMNGYLIINPENKNNLKKITDMLVSCLPEDIFLATRESLDRQLNELKENGLPEEVYEQLKREIDKIEEKTTYH